jgi:2,5-dihydroxypyridine 5,6-dioxygenase
MLSSRIEGKWIDCFARVFARCKVGPGDCAAILTDAEARAQNADIAELALLRLGCLAFRIALPPRALATDIPIRSSGASHALEGYAPVIAALRSATLVVDLTSYTLVHDQSLKAILDGGARILMLSYEHPELLERTEPDEELERRTRLGIERMKAARVMRVTSPAGTDLAVDVSGGKVGGGWGYCTDPGTISYWPGGFVAVYPRAGTVAGRVVLARGDINITFKRFVESPVALILQDDRVVAIEGDGVDAALMREYYAVWNDSNAYAVAHVGWGMSHRARWHALTMYDKSELNATEARAFAGNFLFSTGASTFAGRHTLAHFDIPMRGCTVTLDGAAVVEGGKLVGDLA